MIVKEVKCRSVLNASKLPGIDYCINPYTGCGHGCRYCYADFMRKYAKRPEAWGSFVDVKVNAPDVLRKQMRSMSEGTVYFSSVTDPYQPLERKYELTRRCLGVLAGHGFSVSIQTKSALVLRDMDMIKGFKSIEVGFSICMNDHDAARLEPGADPPSERIKALKNIHSKGVRTYVFLAPVIAGITDYPKIIEDTFKWADHYFIDRLNMRGCASRNMESPPKGYYDDVKNEISFLLKGKPHTFCF
ncbi:MAG: radical SAM protein [Candidatus Aenigmatarchaeota archaeon]|nr:MAG: radical SAM protein [Candidatus Aenigmarchaeota archaeon]